ncbi:predicted protein [Histoplasma capsulatum G186AR]|uniref:Secreted protein n=2 Tax=Ajellomyces capsulatus TaxID=5037 RepID=C0NX97_AJECG|nr:uncharacterized protein HCBG_08089 [Histoplasma capsulatum G186AR]EEH03963.1 predicted protein [Histoplasma capsulatum G186AR]
MTIPVFVYVCAWSFRSVLLGFFLLASSYDLAAHPDDSHSNDPSLVNNNDINNINNNNDIHMAKTCTNHLRLDTDSLRCHPRIRQSHSPRLWAIPDIYREERRTSSGEDPSLKPGFLSLLPASAPDGDRESLSLFP